MSTCECGFARVVEGLGGCVETGGFRGFDYGYCGAGCGADWAGAGYAESAVEMVRRLRGAAGEAAGDWVGVTVIAYGVTAGFDRTSY